MSRLCVVCFLTFLTGALFVTNAAGTESSTLLASGPSWHNINITKAPFAENTAVRFAVSGFSDLYHPFFAPRFSCQLLSGNVRRRSTQVPVKAVKDEFTGRVFYVVDCVLPGLPQPSRATFSRIADVSLLFHKVKTVLFSGQSGDDKLLLYVGWHSLSPDNFNRGERKTIFVQGHGFSSNSKYSCQFVDKFGAFLHVNSTPTFALSERIIPCRIPQWSFTSDKRTTVHTRVSVWYVDPQTNALVAPLPFFGKRDVSDQYVFDRCQDGIKNGAETDTDCGRLCPKRCPRGAACLADSDCEEGSPCVSQFGRKTCTAIPGKTPESAAENCATVSPKIKGFAWIKWNNTAVQMYCDDNQNSLGGDGKSPSSAGISCDSVNTYFRQKYPSTSSAVIWINPKRSSKSTDVFQIYCDFSMDCGLGDSGGWSIVYSSRDDSGGNNNMQKGTRHSAVITTMRPGNANKKLAYDVLSSLYTNAKPFKQVMLTGYQDYRNPGTLVKICFNDTARSNPAGQPTFKKFIDWGIGRNVGGGHCGKDTFHGTELQTGNPMLLSWENYAFVAGHGNRGCAWSREVWNEIDAQGGHLLPPSLWPARAESYSRQTQSAGACGSYGLFHIFVR